MRGSVAWITAGQVLGNGPSVSCCCHVEFPFLETSGPDLTGLLHACLPKIKLFVRSPKHMHIQTLANMFDCCAVVLPVRQPVLLYGRILADVLLRLLNILRSCPC